MKECNIVRDLIPLYVEELTAADSSEFIDQHLMKCSTCSEFHNRIKQDVEQQTSTQKPNREHLDQLVARLAQYQSNIKLAAALTAIMLSCIISGASVPFLSTIPFLFLIPFLCRLFVHQSWPLIASAIPFGLIGGLLSDNAWSFIPFFMVVALFATSIGVGAGALWKWGMHRVKLGLKLAGIILPALMMIASSMMYFSFWGNPVGYIEAMIKTKDYVKENYEEGTLTYQRVRYNFKDSQHYGVFEYILHGSRQQAHIGVFKDGRVVDDYQFVLEMQFTEERSADLKAQILAAIDYSPVYISASPETQLAITHDELNDRFYHLSYDLERRDKAAALRASESGKLNYAITLGPFSTEYDVYTKEQFLDKAEAVLNTLQDRNIPFHQVEIKAMLPDQQIQSVSFTPLTTPKELNDRYEIELNKREIRREN